LAKEATLVRRNAIEEVVDPIATNDDASYAMT
jgi:hypothetical protein